MAYGIQIQNSSGAIQISDGLPNYALREVVVAANFGSVGPYSAETVVAFAPTVFASQYKPSLFNNKAYVFSPCSEFSPSSSGYGFEVYGPSSELFFTSLRLPLVVVDYVEIDAEVDTTLVKTYTSGRKYAVIPLVENILQTDYSVVTSANSSADSQSNEWTMSFKVNDHVVTFEKKAHLMSEFSSTWISGSEDEGWAPIPLAAALPGYPTGANQTIVYGAQPRLKALVVDVTHAE